ncbi:MAG: YicC family protein [Candidatus Omnitrophica bacterium]|nr:YicC family protein [Candidatus Omnitrophota bacterium]MCM8791402.1 YicC family protein [Candidatus Omnitrophota bacterium]
MVRSMTGFGRAEVRFGNGKITVEIKTVNHKFFDATLKLPNGIMAFEDKIKEVLQKNILRGKVNLSLTYDGKPIKQERISVNRDIAKNYYKEFSRMRKALGLKDDVTITSLITLPGVLNYESGAGRISRMWPKLKEAIEKAVERLIADREKEGRHLYNDLMSRARHIETMLSRIKARSHLNIEEYRSKFADRIKALTGGRDIDTGRLEMEVAIFAKNSDISEEITRLKNHLANFKKTMSSDGDVGKKIDFIAQELHREINTIGSKACDFNISKNVIEIKSEIEKIREQAKNLE